MFTGLVEEIGAVIEARTIDASRVLSIRAETVLEDARLGDSIAVNGVCLTVTAREDDAFTVGLAPETLSRTNLGDLSQGDPVNLERSVLPTTRLGGHFVQGHVDGKGVIEGFRPDGDALWLTVKTDPDFMRYIVTKGYIAVDGASLTVVDTGADWFNVTLIDYTQQKIILPRKSPGDSVNLEVDILAKYAERAMAGRLESEHGAPAPSQSDPDTLSQSIRKEGAR